MKVAVDGPAGSGKSSICRALASRLGFVYVDTGAMYRAIGLYALRAGANLNCEGAVAAVLPCIRLRLSAEEGVQHIYLNEEDVTGLIRTEEVSMAASAVAKYATVRTFLLEAQRALAQNADVLMDGRDIGTVVLPDAEVKIYLTAASEVRARRRYLELLEKGQPADYLSILEDVRARDAQDMNRAVAPLKQAEDAVLLDTSDLDFEQSVAAARAIIEEKRG